MDFVLRLMMPMLFGGIIAWHCFSQYDHEIGEEADSEKRTYMPYVPSLMLPTVLVLLLCLRLPLVGLRQTVQQLVSFCFGLFLSVSLYYPLLQLLLPALRKRMSARGCALLWLIPNYLYVICYDFIWLPKPWLVLPVRDTVFHVAVGIWLTGFLGVLLWKTVEHIRFRREILKDARPVTDPEVLRIWKAELDASRLEKEEPKNISFYRKMGIRVPTLAQTLVISPHVRTPLSIGGTGRLSMRVILPERNYTAEEMTLLLRHELVHICREDSSNKFFLVFCKALCWFHPLMWLAMEKSAEDLELSCDETVLLGADSGTRKQYAELLLQTAGDGRGFTTCLSASAASVRYRLKQIVKPRKASSGALAVFLAFAVLCMSFGYVTLSFDAGTCAQAVFGDAQPELTGVFFHGEEGQLTGDGSEEALLEYLAGLPVSYLPGNYLPEDEEQAFTVLCREENRSYAVTVHENTLSVRPLNGKDKEKTYYLGTEVDWTYILTLVK